MGQGSLSLENTHSGGGEFLSGRFRRTNFLANVVRRRERKNPAVSERRRWEDNLVPHGAWFHRQHPSQEFARFFDSRYRRRARLCRLLGRKRGGAACL